MFGLGTGELVILLVVILLLFGAKRIPMLGESFGKSIKSFKKGLKDADREDKSEGHKKNQDSKENDIGPPKE